MLDYKAEPSRLTCRLGGGTLAFVCRGEMKSWKFLDIRMITMRGSSQTLEVYPRHICALGMC